jgi:hypothetical protein
MIELRTRERDQARASTDERNAVIEELGKALDDICRDRNPDWTEKRRYPCDVLDDIHKTAVDAYYGPLRALKDAPDA